MRPDGEVEDGATIAVYRVIGASSNRAFHVNVEAQVTYDIAFDKNGPATGSILVKGLADLVEVVGQVGGILRNLPEV